MKKKILFGLAGIVVMAAAIVTVNSINANSNESDLLSKNIEALSQSEDGYYYGDHGCPIFPSTCYGIVVTPTGNYGVEYAYAMN